MMIGFLREGKLQVATTQGDPQEFPFKAEGLGRSFDWSDVKIRHIWTQNSLKSRIEEGDHFTDKNRNNYFVTGGRKIYASPYHSGKSRGLLFSYQYSNLVIDDGVVLGKRETANTLYPIDGKKNVIKGCHWGEITHDGVEMTANGMVVKNTPQLDMFEAAGFYRHTSGAVVTASGIVILPAIEGKKYVRVVTQGVDSYLTELVQAIVTEADYYHEKAGYIVKHSNYSVAALTDDNVLTIWNYRKWYYLNDPVGVKWVYTGVTSRFPYIVNKEIIFVGISDMGYLIQDINYNISNINSLGNSIGNVLPADYAALSDDQKQMLQEYAQQRGSGRGKYFYPDHLESRIEHMEMGGDGLTYFHLAPEPTDITAMVLNGEPESDAPTNGDNNFSFDKGHKS